MLVVGGSMNNIILGSSNVINFEYGLERLKKDDQVENWKKCKLLHIHLISGIVCRNKAIEIYPNFHFVSGSIYNKDLINLKKRSPYFYENIISLARRRGTCECRCSTEYIADEILIRGVSNIKPNHHLGLRQEEDEYDYFFDGDDPVKTKFPPFKFSKNFKHIKEA